MTAPLTAPQILNREFLEMRAKILELGASFDRLNRGGSSVADDPRLLKLREALDVLLENKGDCAEQIQLIFSRPYDNAWQQHMHLSSQ